MTITHRVVGTKKLDNGEVCLVTRGDNNTQEDSTCVEKQNLIGVTKAVIPGLGKIQFFLSSGIGWLMIIILPALYIIFKDIVKIFKLTKEMKKENQENEENNNQNLEEAYNDLKKVKMNKKDKKR